MHLSFVWVESHKSRYQSQVSKTTRRQRPQRTRDGFRPIPSTINHGRSATRGMIRLRHPSIMLPLPRRSDLLLASPWLRCRNLPCTFSARVSAGGYARSINLELENLALPADERAAAPKLEDQTFRVPAHQLPSREMAWIRPSLTIPGRGTCRYRLASAGRDVLGTEAAEGSAGQLEASRSFAAASERASLFGQRRVAWHALYSLREQCNPQGREQ
ncbi:hypothetical protein CALVIDRAFT_316994 [Calocera viscosa TUFC12733]|uniref:Uncharacterized protein n=1 Tax=Calocera viscosa (strain TUFC12733) TaxID=1330018 RepID=A0A167I1U9_CALVF|nr:hypothetical protein CALVIDRAFT_316994 [Calocera viscosa TUFC12733]